MRFQGGGSSHINTMPVRSAAEILKEYNENISYAAGYDSRTEKELPELEKEAEELAKNSDLVLFFGGLTDRTGGGRVRQKNAGNAGKSEKTAGEALQCK